MKHRVHLTPLIQALLFAGFFISVDAVAAPPRYTFDFNTQCEAAYQYMLSMRYEEARTILSQQKIEAPQNLIITYIDDYADFLQCAFNEDRKEFNRLYPNKDKRLTALSKGDTKSPYYLYTQAQVSLHWAIVNLKFENYTSAFIDIHRAYNYLTENQTLYPDFKANLIGLGFMHALIGTVPDSYKWAVRLIGFNGSVNQGKNEMLEAIEYSKGKHFIFQNEAKYMYLLLQLIVLNDKQGAYQTVSQEDFPTHYGNALSCFIKAYIALKNYKNDEAIKFFSYNIYNNKTEVLYNYYLLGMCQLNKLNTDAYYNLKYFSENFQGVNYLKDARNRMAWCALLNGRMQDYFILLEKVTEGGNTLSDSDKAAQNAAKQKSVPDIELLKARLLMDGGYFNQALSVIDKININSLNKPELLTEYQYRKGRIYHLKGDISDAINYYTSCIESGRAVPVYFAANAAMELGNIYAANQNYELAKKYYKMSLAMPDSDFKNSIDVRSKAGLQRIEASK